MTENNVKAPIMQRSRSQIMTSYSPGTFFTFEGGLAACKSVAVSVSKVELPAHTVRLIRDRIEELIRGWYERAITARGDGGEEILPGMCIDSRLIDNSGRGVRGDLGSLFEFVVPSKVGYIPEPTTLICSNCNRIHWFDNVTKMYQGISRLQNEKCLSEEHEFCDFQQLDVLFVHWSGGVEPAKPEKNQWYQDSGVTNTYWRCTCGSNDVILDRSESQIGNWSFKCGSCGLPQTDRWTQLDRGTLELLGERFFSESRRADVAMEASSYRASVVHYVQKDSVIAFKDGSLLEKLNPLKIDELKTFVARCLGLAREEMNFEYICEAIGEYPEESANLDNYKNTFNLIEKMESIEQFEAANQFRVNTQNIKDEWIKKGYLNPPVKLPISIETGIETRSSFPSKYDPFRLLIEHESLENECLKVGPGPNRKRPFVPFNNPDDDLIHRELEQGIGGYEKRLGVSRMGLIRKFELCFFSYGYSRMSSTPVLPDKHNITMPVKLNLFQQVNVAGRQASPVYTINQENEAIYIQLSEPVVKQWLIAQGCVESESLETEPLKKVLLENVFPMSDYLDNLPTRDDQNPPSAFLSTYTLLHTYSHHIIHSITEFAGLDSGSLGEYIFPADLSFVVYRSGMTMDLGNISAMWRNNGKAFLDHLLMPTSLNCGLGTLCTERGGACPNCIMIPEVSCIAQNRLLSRSVLNGDGHPEEDGVNERIEGYFDIAASSTNP